MTPVPRSADGGTPVDTEEATDDDNGAGVVDGNSVVGEVDALGARDEQSCCVGL